MSDDYRWREEHAEELSIYSYENEGLKDPHVGQNTRVGGSKCRALKSTE